MRQTQTTNCNLEFNEYLEFRLHRVQRAKRDVEREKVCWKYCDDFVSKLKWVKKSLESRLLGKVNIFFWVLNLNNNQLVEIKNRRKRLNINFFKHETFKCLQLCIMHHSKPIHLFGRKKRMKRKRSKQSKENKYKKKLSVNKQRAKCKKVFIQRCQIVGETCTRFWFSSETLKRRNATMTIRHAIMLLACGNRFTLARTIC